MGHICGLSFVVRGGSSDEAKEAAAAAIAHHGGDQAAQLASQAHAESSHSTHADDEEESSVEEPDDGLDPITRAVEQARAHSPAQCATTPHPWPEPCLRQAMASNGQNAPVHDWTDAKWSHTIRSVLNADTSVNRDLHSSARVAHQIARERMKDHHLELERMGDNLSEACALPSSPPLEQPT